MATPPFYSVMDNLEEYDLKLTHLNELYGEAMISLAYISFVNPHSSISPQGYKPSPALLRHNIATN